MATILQFTLLAMVTLTLTETRNNLIPRKPWRESKDWNFVDLENLVSKYVVNYDTYQAVAGLARAAYKGVQESGKEAQALKYQQYVNDTLGNLTKILVRLEHKVNNYHGYPEDKSSYVQFDTYVDPDFVKCVVKCTEAKNIGTFTTNGIINCCQANYTYASGYCDNNTPRCTNPTSWASHHNIEKCDYLCTREDNNARDELIRHCCSTNGLPLGQCDPNDHCICRHFGVI